MKIKLLHTMTMVKGEVGAAQWYCIYFLIGMYMYSTRHPCCNASTYLEEKKYFARGSEVPLYSK